MRTSRLALRFLCVYLSYAFSILVLQDALLPSRTAPSLVASLLARWSSTRDGPEMEELHARLRHLEERLGKAAISDGEPARYATGPGGRNKARLDASLHEERADPVGWCGTCVWDRKKTCRERLEFVVARRGGNRFDTMLEILESSPQCLVEEGAPGWCGMCIWEHKKTPVTCGDRLNFVVMKYGKDRYQVMTEIMADSPQCMAEERADPEGWCSACIWERKLTCGERSGWVATKYRKNRFHAMLEVMARDPQCNYVRKKRTMAEEQEEASGLWWEDEQFGS
ncbi:hypothetical protein ACHAXT_000226 [Thalassiosira profunda]